MRKVFYVLLSVSLVGCAVIPQLNPASSKVSVVTSHERVNNCESLGLVYGYSDNGFRGYAGAGGISQQHSVFDAQNKTAEKGGDTVLIINTNSRTGGTDTTGEAYLCNKK
jgi:hypothetical protein